MRMMVALVVHGTDVRLLLVLGIVLAIEPFEEGVKCGVAEGLLRFLSYFGFLVLWVIQRDRGFWAGSGIWAISWLNNGGSF